MSISISAFGDEIAEDLEEQLKTLQELKIPHLDLRAAWGVRVDNLSDEQLDKIVELLAKYDISVACLGSPIGKYPIQDSMDSEIKKLRRLAVVGLRVGTKNIRMFSYYPQGDVTEDEIQLSISRLNQLIEEAEKLGLILLLENEKGLVGDTPERMERIFKAIDTPTMRFIWDPANFVQCKAENQVDEWWDALSPYIGYIHIKDAKLADGSVTPAGDGDGQVEKLLKNLNDTSYSGILSLEPHLQQAMHSSGFSGPDMMKVAVDSLRAVMKSVGMSEA